VKLQSPAGLTVVLGLVGGVLEYLAQATFHIEAPWQQVIVFGLYVIGIFGVSPLTHGAFRNALHISVALGTSITVGAAVLAAGITTFSMSPDLKGILEGVLAFLAFVGFGPVATPVPPA
jgi:hypothetical protein